jgi:hypothetical protein
MAVGDVKIGTGYGGKMNIADDKLELIRNLGDENQKGMTKHHNSLPHG